ncbi:hypothetical protein BHS05_19020 [Myxococcus xanthus]|nr:hypothetical protein BHS05_19020 [Myxococcus xanthus]
MAGRRFLLYFAWSRVLEEKAPLGTLENRYPALFELRRAIWPHYEWAADRERYRQGIAGFLEHVILFDFQRFIQVILEATGNAVTFVERQSAEGGCSPLDDRLLSCADTVIVVSLDHQVTEQTVNANEVAAVRRFLMRSGTALIVCPHHDVGAPQEQSAREVEFLHHGDRLVSSQQRLGGVARSLLAELGFPVENRYGLRPAAAPDGGPAPLDVATHLDTPGFLVGVETFNLHAHLPHLWVPPALEGHVRVLARQLIHPSAPPHPFVERGHDRFNAMLWMPPDATRAGHLIVCDATIWSSAFGGLTSLNRFWRNLAQMPASYP